MAGERTPWGDLFERAAAREATLEDVRERLAARRADRAAAERDGADEERADADGRDGDARE